MTPTLRNRIRQWLGLTQLDGISYEVHYIHKDYVELRNEIHASSLAVARLIAKLDPNYAVDYANPTLRKASDDIARSVINKLLADDAMQKRHI